MSKSNNTTSRLCTRMSRVPEFLLSAIGIVLLLLLTLLPGEELPDAPQIPLIDKWAHILAFGLVSTALLFDFGRRRGRISWFMWLVAGIAVTALGIVIEWLQDLMALGRSADIMDVAADAAGAFLLPLLFMPLLRMSVRSYLCDLVPFTGDKATLDRVRQLYIASFPPEERRDWNDLQDKTSDPREALSLLIIRSRRRFAGFITSWDLGGVRYVEHFAVDPSQRGSGIGANAITRFVGMAPSPVVLEVEPASDGDMARRRISFYRRCGFTAHPDFPYIQPSYAPGLPELPLMLMTAGPTPGQLDLPTLSDAIRTQVYAR